MQIFATFKHMSRNLAKENACQCALYPILLDKYSLRGNSWWWYSTVIGVIWPL